MERICASDPNVFVLTVLPPANTRVPAQILFFLCLNTSHLTTHLPYTRDTILLTSLLQILNLVFGTLSNPK